MPSVREFRVKIPRSHRTSCIARCLRWLVQTNNYALHDIDQMRCVWVSERKYLRFFVEITCVWILLALIWMRVPTAFLVFSRKLNKTEIKWVSKTRRTQTPAHLHFGNWRVLIVPFRELSVPVRWRCHTQFSTNSFVSKSMSSSKWMPHAISVWIEVFPKATGKAKKNENLSNLVIVPIDCNRFDLHEFCAKRTGPDRCRRKWWLGVLVVRRYRRWKWRKRWCSGECCKQEVFGGRGRITTRQLWISWCSLLITWLNHIVIFRCNKDVMKRCARNESVLLTSRVNLCAIARVYHLKNVCSHRSSEWTWIRCQVAKTHWVCSQHDMVCLFAKRMWTGYKMVDKCTICYIVQWTKCAPIRCVRAWVQFRHVLSNQTNICIKHVSPRKTYKLYVFCVKTVYLHRNLMLLRLSMAMIQALFAPKPTP